MKKLLAISTFALAGAAVLFAAKPVKAFFTLDPPMTCQNCEKKVKGNIRFEKGVKNVETSISDNVVTVSYDPDKTTPEKLTKALEKLGYDAEVVPDTTANSL